MIEFPEPKHPGVSPIVDAEKGIIDPKIVGPLFGIAELDVAMQWEDMSSAKQMVFEKRLVRKLDLRLIPWLTLLYLISFLDRANIGNAKIQGVLLTASVRRLIL